MASLTIRQLDDHIKERLRRRAAANGRSMEEEARIAISDHVSEPASGNAYDALRRGMTFVDNDVNFPRIRGKMRPLPDIFNE